LTLAYRQQDEFHTQIGIQRSQRETYQKEIEVRQARIKGNLAVPDINLLTALSNYATALAAEYQFIAQYNIALAQYEFDKGTIMQRDNVQIGEGALTDCAAVRAVDHEKERAAALILRERENPVNYTPCNVWDVDTLIPALPKDRAPSLPSLLEKAPTPAAELLSVPPMPPSDPATKTSSSPAPRSVPTFGYGMPSAPSSDATVRKSDSPTAKATPTIGIALPNPPSSGAGSSKSDNVSAKPMAPTVGNNLPYVPSGTGVLRVGQPSSPSPVPSGGTSVAPAASGSDGNNGPKLVPAGTTVDTGWTPRP
jgi:hypothetical protein